MIVKPKPGFEAPVRIADSINPFLVILSIVGIFLEYTPLKSYVVPFNQALDALFVLDFVLRLVCHRPLPYLLKGYGWVDLLASLPGFLLVFTYTPLLAAFKFVRIGRFFKIIRVLRFLRVFNFLKRMKSESPWIQDRVMKIGVSIVLCMVVGTFLLDHGMRVSLESTRSAALGESLALAGGDPRLLSAAGEELIAWRVGGSYFDAAGKPLAGGEAAWDRALDDELHWAIQVDAKSPAAKADAALIRADDLMEQHDRLMLILLGTLVALLLVVVFYVGAVFAKDMSGVHLIIDSIEADDLQLLEQEALRLGGGSLDIERDESEMTSLVKVVAKLGRMRSGSQPTDLGLDIPGLSLGLGAERDFVAGAESYDEAPLATGSESPGREDELVSRLESLVARLESLEESRELEHRREDRRLVVETAQVITPAIARLAKRVLGEAAQEQGDEDEK